MIFHFGYSETILFNDWKIQTIFGLCSSFLGIFLISMIYEAIRYYREFLLWTNNKKMKFDGANMTKPGLFNKHHSIQTGLHLIQTTTTYLIMLLFMVFNVWLCIGIILGSTLGYFLFGKKRAPLGELEDHC